jgi:hypothetical protein
MSVTTTATRSYGGPLALSRISQGELDELQRRMGARAGRAESKAPEGAR